MEKVITTEKVPIKLWLNDIEDGAMEQVINMANLPFVFKHVAIMPDAHQGYGMPIGGVLATKGVVIPNAVGVDIGCGMCAVKTNLTDIDIRKLKMVVERIKEVVPVGFNHQKGKQDESLMPCNPVKAREIMKIVPLEYEKALYQIGTLGGGNHFIEIQKGSDGFIWVMIHSGSRNIGLKVANYYNKLAEEINQSYYSEVKKDIQLAFLPMHTPFFVEYFTEMQFCVNFALANRLLMLERIKEIISLVGQNVIFDEPINIAHNYARWENHYNTNVVVHRKGATSAKDGEIGIIPGSQGTKSYIVEGLGNPLSFMSCSHRAGRKMGRKQAQRTLNLKDELFKMGSILHGMRGEQDLDEAIGAYKDIDEVMANQKDLVKILVELTPLAVIKG